MNLVLANTIPGQDLIIHICYKFVLTFKLYIGIINTFLCIYIKALHKSSSLIFTNILFAHIWDNKLKINNDRKYQNKLIFKIIWKMTYLINSRS